MEASHEQTILMWSAPLRPFKKRSFVLIRFFFAIALILSAIVFFVGDLITILPIWAILFLFYIFAITPPPIVENRVTALGIETGGGIVLRWNALSYYYFTERLGYTICVVVGHSPYNTHTYLVVDTSETRTALDRVLAEHLMRVSKPPKTFVDKAVSVFSSLVPEVSDATTANIQKTT
jgi:hypothetical protein